jgi:hypothetical protein
MGEIFLPQDGGGGTEGFARSLMQSNNRVRQLHRELKEDSPAALQAVD